jgi:hypothetical protein
VDADEHLPGFLLSKIIRRQPKGHLSPSNSGRVVVPISGEERAVSDLPEAGIQDVADVEGDDLLASVGETTVPGVSRIGAAVARVNPDIDRGARGRGDQRSGEEETK